MEGKDTLEIASMTMKDLFEITKPRAGAVRRRLAADKAPYAGFAVKIPLLLMTLGWCCLLQASPYKAVLADQGGVTVEVASELGEIDLARDFDLTMSVTYPDNMKVELPDMTALRGRFQGFAVAEGFSRDPVKLPDGRLSLEYRWRLVPEPAAAKYRLAPFAVQTRPLVGVQSGSFPTAPAVFPVGELERNVAGDVEIAPKPYWIAPTTGMILRWIALALGAAAVVFLAVFFARKISRAAKLRRMSPSERAFVELDALLGRKLTEKGLFKDFYIELTHVVRRYIERSHGIKAPEQTTEEFLAAAKAHPRFTPEVLAKLSDFLTSADLVKFAGLGSSSSLAEDAVKTARGYIESDAAQTAAELQANGEGRK